MNRFAAVALMLLGILATPSSAQRLKITASVPALEEAAQRDSTDAAAHYNLALGYWTKSKWDQVDTELRQALAIDPRFASAYLALAFLPQASGKFWEEHHKLLGDGWILYWYTAPDSVMESFDRLYRHAFMIDPLVDIRIQVATEYRAGHIDSFDRALYAYNDGKWDEAYQRFGELVADSGNYGEEKAKLFEQVLWYHALAGARLGNNAEAIADLQRLIVRSENREASDTMYRWPLRTNEYRYTLAYVTQRSGDPNAAVRLYHDVLANDLGLYMAHVRVADIYEANAMWEQAIAARRNAVNANPDDPSLVLDLGKTLANATRWDEAERSLRESANANPRDPRVPFYQGLVLEHLGRKEDARAAFTRFITVAPARYERQVAMAKQHLAALH